MVANLYETLGTSKDATAEQIRKAYRKKALQTHPDRLPAGSTLEDKKNAEEKFRQVNHAYEVLIDEQKRKEYDIHGVWPPPEPEEVPFFANGFGGPRAHHSFHDPFHHHHHPFSSFMFTDPFELFNSIFGDLRDDFDDADDNFGFRPFSSPFSSFGGLSPFGGFGRTHNMFSDDFFGPSFITSSPFGSMNSNTTVSIGGGKWASESYSSTTINGVTETIHKRRDQDGNEHVTKTYNDGRQVNYINGVEQPSGGYLTQNAPGPSHTSRHDMGYLPQPQHRPQPQHHHHSQSHSHNVHPKMHHNKTAATKHASPPPTRAPYHSSPSRPYRREAQPSAYPNTQPQDAAPYDYNYNYNYNMPSTSMSQHEAPPPPYPGNNTNTSYVQYQPASGPEYHRRRDRHHSEKHGHESWGVDPGKHDRHRERKSWLPHPFGRN